MEEGKKDIKDKIQVDYTIDEEGNIERKENLDLSSEEISILKQQLPSRKQMRRIMKKRGVSFSDSIYKKFKITNDRKSSR